jgi:hypothetical protein
MRGDFLKGSCRDALVADEFYQDRLGWHSA